MIDVVEVKDAIRDGRISIQVKNGTLLMQDMQTEEAVKLSDLHFVSAVHARWILKHVGAGHYWECSSCRTNPCIYVTKNTKYCPNCGARMDGEEVAID